MDGAVDRNVIFVAYLNIFDECFWNTFISVVLNVQSVSKFSEKLNATFHANIFRSTWGSCNSIINSRFQKYAKSNSWILKDFR